MPTFSTPGGVSVIVNLPTGDLLLVASDRTDTVVLPHTGDDDSAGLRVSYADGRLVVDGPQPRNGFASWLGLGESFEARIDLPEGSNVRGVALEGGFRSMGRLGACTFRTDYGEIVLDETGPLTVTTESGDIIVRQVTGDAEVTSDSGVIQIQRIDGGATITNEYGETEIREITGLLRVHGRDSDLLVGRTHGDVEAFSESGDIRIAEVASGTVNTTSESGSIEISVPGDAAVAVDLESPNGRVRNSLLRSGTAGQSDRSITVRARSQQGDITLTPLRPLPSR